MTKLKIPKRVSTALINSLSSGVVPRSGLEYIAVGREGEITALLRDLENISEGGSTYRFIAGRYGSGKSFLLQLLRNYAMGKDFVVADVDLSPERRLAGTNNQGLATYRELINNMATKTRPDGGALQAILEKWISNIQTKVMKEDGIKPKDDGFCDAVEVKIMEVVNNMEGMVHGFDFATILSTYWRGHKESNEEMKSNALRWLRGEFSTKTEAKKCLDVRVIIDDSSWYDYIKLLANFVKQIGYDGLIVVIDEAVNLYKITNAVSRNNNYEKVLTLFNDTMQGKASSLGIIMGITPKALDDTSRGIFSYEALKSRLSDSRFITEGTTNLLGPVIRLETLNHNEIYVLLNKLTDVHAVHYKYDNHITDENIQNFMKEVISRMGADKLLTPREVIRDFIAILNAIYQNEGLSFDNLVQSSEFQTTKADDDPDEVKESDYAEFSV